MKRRCWMGVLAAGLGLAVGSQAEVRLPADSPFQVILVRNPFGLRPPPTNVVVVPTSAPPVQVNVNLSGITYVGGKKRAWMVIPAGGTRTNTTTFSMGEGDPEFEGVRVERIDVDQGTVQILKNGTPTTLDFQNNGLAYSGPVTVNVPGAARPGRIPAPGQPRTAVPVPNPGAVRTAAPGVNPSAAVNVPGGATGLANNPQVIPARAIRTAPQEAPEPVDPAMQIIRMKAEEMRARSEGVVYPPLPPVPGLDGLE
ncbi:MAG: hypothetical protein KJ072_24180 [Verrucomicrobia bacterium]|nr:hypothetical protein [Verrucomicrobiota bacterium]